MYPGRWCRVEGSIRSFLVLELGVALVDGGLVTVGVVDAVHEVARRGEDRAWWVPLT